VHFVDLSVVNWLLVIDSAASEQYKVSEFLD
jgi:hypothetical protein